MKPIPANGTTGILIARLYDEFVFRVYNADHTYVDYEINHSDLQVTICDEDAYFYDGLYLDHSPETFGITE